MTTTTGKVTQYLADCDMSKVRRKDVAQILGIKVGALSHLLECEGRTFTDLVMAERKRRTLAMLAANPEVSGCQVSPALGYNSVESFYQEFPKWFSMTWRKFRREHA